MRLMGWTDKTYASVRLNHLIDIKALERKHMPSELGLGGAAWVYKVGAEGRKALRSLNIPVDRLEMGHREDLVSVTMRAGQIR